MASLSIVRPRTHTAGQRPLPAEEPVPGLVLRVRIDPRGIIQSVQSGEGCCPIVSRPVEAGSSYYSLLAEICGEKIARAAAVSAGIRTVAAGQADMFSIEFPCQLPDREMRLCLVAAPYGLGGVDGILLTHTDADAAGDEPQKNKMETLGKLAGGVAHDFANLVTLISGYADILLKRTGSGHPCRPELEEIRKAAARGAGTSAQILDFIRKQVAMPAALQLNELVAETMRMLRPLIGEHISLAVHLDPQLAMVHGDAAQMSRVIMNLVLNARDAMPRGGSIRIRTANRDGRVLLEVSDTGCGMDHETLRQIFQPFFTTKNGAGTGLGLSTVRRIVEQAGGEIQTRSERGVGTTFTICLPRTEQAIGKCDSDSDSLPRTASTGTETILLAEDEASVRKLLKHILDASGYRVLEAGDGRDALRVLEQHSGSIDLLLTDIIMPGLNGRDLARKAMASQPGLKVIYMSGYTDDVLSDAGALGPGSSFLRKPLKLDVLSALIRDVLDKPPVQ